MCTCATRRFRCGRQRTSEIWHRPKLEHDSFCNGGSMYKPSREVSFHSQITFPMFSPDVGPSRKLCAITYGGLHTPFTTYLSRDDIVDSLSYWARAWEELCPTSSAERGVFRVVGSHSCVLFLVAQSPSVGCSCNETSLIYTCKRNGPGAALPRQQHRLC